MAQVDISGHLRSQPRRREPFRDQWGPWTEGLLHAEHPPRPWVVHERLTGEFRYDLSRERRRRASPKDV
jgi:hypothetical protein